MAVDQNSIPKDLRPLNLNRTPTSQWAPLHLQPPIPSPPSDAPPDGPQSAVKKIKLLCSFGGKILPRPTDGALRYVGGQTRIISVPKDTPFPDLMAKMAESSGGAAVLKYQLPDEDLDALISVSGAEDLENMVDEYDKLVEASPDGSAKLRAFLFSPTEVSDPSAATDLGDTGHRYFEAVNGISHEGGGGGLKRRDSGLSVGSSNHNSDCGTPGYEGASDGAVLSPRIVAAVGVPPQTQTLNSANYLSPNSYVDPHQVQFLNSQHVNLTQFPVHVSTAAVASPVSQVNSFKPVQPPPRLDENLYGGIQNYKGVQPLSQLPPLSPYQQVPNFELYGLHSGMAQGQGFRFDDCHMCQKALPHAHSDPVVQDPGNGSPGSGPEVSPVFYSQRVGEPMRSPPQHLVNGGLADNAAEPRVDSTARGGRLGGAYGFPQVPAAQFESARPFVQKIENLDHARVFVPPGSMGLSPDAQSSYGLFLGNFPEYHQEELLQQQQLQQNLGLAQSPVKPEMNARQVGNDASLVENMRLEATPEFSYNHAKPVNAMMEGLHLNPSGVSALNGQGKAVARPNPGSPAALKSDDLSLVAENSHGSRTQIGGNAVFLDREFAKPGLVPDGNYVKTINQQPMISDLAQMHNLQPADTSQMPTVPGTHSPYAHYLATSAEPPMPSQGLLIMPPYRAGMNPSYNDSASIEIPTGDLKDLPSQFSTKDMVDLLAAPYSGNAPFNLSNATRPTELLEPFQEPSSSDSLFCNQDPRKILGGAHPLPPKPRRVASKESIAAKDSNVVTHLGNSNESDIIALLEEGGLHPFSVSQNKVTRQEPVRILKDVKGSGDEQIKQDLQAVAEGVATSVLQSSLSQEMKEANHDFKDERKVTESSAELQAKVIPMDQKIEDSKHKQSDKMNPGVRITNDIGRLQIINTNDLEELRELGSGTFGTVYHGKWRGTDVAIKRINDRCFAGKPSEQERMRADFWNEACNLADLHHPNVVAFYGVVLDGPGGSVATVTEYMVNGSLRNALQRNEKTLDRRKRLLIAMDVAFGMEYLHGKNIVHFDLKSDNLLVNLRDPQRPICKVGDLGLSKVKCQTLISGGVRGTLPWMAPELLNGISSLVSEKVDVFSFGIVMWELLTGQEPYADLHYGAIIGGIVSNKLRPPIPESCDPEWKSLMEKCWSADPSERPSFTEIADRLRSMAAALPAKGQAQAQAQK